MPESCDVKITADWALTMGESPRVIEAACVAVTGSHIVWIGSQDDAAGIAATTSVDRPGCALLPGLVNGHTHLFQSLVRSMGDNLGLFGWMREVVSPFMERMTVDDLYIASLAASAEAVRSGTTLVLENHYALTDLDASLSVRSAFEKIGLRGVIARGILGPRLDAADKADLPLSLFRYSASEELELMEECLNHNEPDTLVRFWPSPLMLSFMGTDLARDAIRLARKYGVPWHAHCAETRDDGPLFREVNGLDPVEWLANNGLLGSDTTLAHGIWLTEREVNLLGAAKGTVVHNPVSNGYLGTGVMPLAALRKAGVNVALGSDGPGSNNTLDMFEVMKTMAVLQKASNCDPSVVTAEDVLAFGISGGAKCVGMQDEIGVLAEGRRADLIAVNLSTLHSTPVHRLASTLVHSARGSDVSLTMVDGRVVFDGRQICGVDEPALIDELRERAFSIAGRALSRDVSEHWMRAAQPSSEQ